MVCAWPLQFNAMLGKNWPTALEQGCAITFKKVKSAECRVQETIVWVQLQYHRRSMQLSAPWVYLLLAPDRLDAWPGDSHEPWRHGTPGKQGRKGSWDFNMFWTCFKKSETFWMLLICYEDVLTLEKTWEYRAISFVLLHTVTTSL